jgi:glycosyltransferase involved in cell wall biosynthesis
VRVCLVTLDFAPFRSSGLAVYAERLAEGLASHGHVVTVISSCRAKDEQVETAALPPQIKVVRVPAGRADWIGLGWQAARYLDGHRADFDLVHFLDVHFAYACRAPFIASAFQSFRQRLTSHHGRPYHTNRRNLLFRWVYYQIARCLMERLAVRRARHIIMPSAATQREFVDNYGVAPERTTLVYLGIDLSRFDALPAQTESRGQLGLPIDEKILLYVGFSTPRKGIEYLAQALRIMRTPAHLVMVGKWEAHYPERFLAALGDARARVHLTGYVPDDELSAYFSAADAFVLPTLLEGFGIPLVEAMAARLPIVTTTGGSAGEVAGEAGLTVSPGDSRALAAALDRVLTEPDLARRLSQAGQHRARTLFDERRFAVEIENVYLSVLRTSPDAGTPSIAR